MPTVWHRCDWTATGLRVGWWEGCLETKTKLACHTFALKVHCSSGEFPLHSAGPLNVGILSTDHKKCPLPQCVSKPPLPVLWHSHSNWVLSLSLLSNSSPRAQLKNGPCNLELVEPVSGGKDCSDSDEEDFKEHLLPSGNWDDEKDVLIGASPTLLFFYGSVPLKEEGLLHQKPPLRVTEVCNSPACLAQWHQHTGRATMFGILSTVGLPRPKANPWRQRSNAMEEEGSLSW